jgi:HEAT repeat protein
MIARHLWTRIGRLIGSASALACLLFFAPAIQADPLDELKDALTAGLGGELTKEAIKFRRATLKASAERLRTLNDLYQGYLLPGWLDDPRIPLDFARDPTIYARDYDLYKVDHPIHEDLVKRLGEHLQAGVKAGPASRIAVATFVGEMGYGIRTSGSPDSLILGRRFLPILIRLTEDPDSQVRQATALALGKVIPATGGEVAPALRRLITNTQDVGQRRAAAAALAELLKMIVAYQKVEPFQSSEAPLPFRGKEKKGPAEKLDQRHILTVSPADAVTLTRDLVRVAGLGATDVDAQVRVSSLEALKQGALRLHILVPEPTDLLKDALGRDSFPSYFFSPSALEVPELAKKIHSAGLLIKEQLTIYQPLEEAFAAQGKTLARRLEDPQPDIKLLSRQALEVIASARQRVRRLIQSVPREKGAPPAPDPLLDGLAPSVQIIASGVGDGRTRVRLAAVEFLEKLDEAAQPAIPAVIQALADPDPIVRWVAARTLGHVAPLEPDRVVPALARAAADPDLDARIAAITSLESYGPLAAAAVPALVGAVSTGDVEARERAIQVLPVVMGRQTVPAIDALAAALGQNDIRLRRAAAKSLGMIQSPEAARAIPALQTVLNDADEEVRRLASESLLTIRQLRQPASSGPALGSGE